MKENCGNCKFYDPVRERCFYYAEIEGYGDYMNREQDEEACEEWDNKN